MTTLPVADARAQLSRLIDQATTTHERFEITRNGRRAAVLMSADDYDTLHDTIAVRVGKPIDPPMAPTWTARRGTYRILCLVDDSQRIVEVTAVRHRSDAYRT